MQIRINEPIGNKEKAREVILYLIHKLPPERHELIPYYLYFIDMDYYETYEEQFMGLTYMRWDKGPIGLKICCKRSN